MTTGKTSAPVFRYAAVTFDCPDPAELARFYGAFLGLSVAFSTEDFVFLGQEGAAGLGFNRLAGYRRPVWAAPAPDQQAPNKQAPVQEKQAHIEVGVDDLDAAQAWLVGLGAEVPEFQPDADRWRVLLDPAGHPFCISTLV